MAEGDAKALSRYRIVGPLGEGGQGAVYEAFDLETERSVALKTVRALGGEELVRFKAEFRAARDLRHPHLIELVELFEERGHYYFTMALVRGVDFLRFVRTHVATHAPQASWPTIREPSTDLTVRAAGLAESGIRASLEPDTNAAVSATLTTRRAGTCDYARLRRGLAQLASALVALHDSGFLHRDVKPSNVLVDEQGNVVLIDFGVAHELSRGASAGDVEMSIVGTAPYMAPEQVTGEELSPATDWYAFGVLLFEAMTGRRPFEGETVDLLARKCALDAPSPSQLDENVPGDLDALCTRLLERDAARRPSTAEILAALASGRSMHSAPPVRAGGDALRSAFVGRRDELSKLDAAYARTRTRSARRAVAVVLEGESGVGKTSLAAQFVEGVRARDRRALVLRGRCHEQERVRYNAFDALVDGLARHLASRPPEDLTRVWPEVGVASLAMLFPALAVAVPAPDSDTRAMPKVGIHARDDAFAALRALLAHLAHERPLVLVLEDVQWADADSVALLSEITRGADAPSALFVVTLRAPKDAPPCDAVVALQCETERLCLSGLSEDDARALAHGLLSQSGAHARAGELDELARGAEGHPMFLEELVRHLVTTDAANALLSPNSPHSPNPATSPHPAAPTSRTADLDEALAARVSRLPHLARRILEAVAVSGVPTAHAIIADAVRATPAELSEQVTRLRSERLVRVRGARREDVVEPFHDRVRESVYARIPTGDRRALHLALADALERRGARDEVLFSHFQAAGDEARAAEAAARAGDAALEALAFASATTFYKAALEHPARFAPMALNALREHLGDAYAGAGRPGDAGAAYLAAANGATSEAHALDLVRRAAESLLSGGHIAQGLDATRRLLAAFGTELPESRMDSLAKLVFYDLRLRARSLTWKARPQTPEMEREIARLDAYWSVGVGLAMVDTIRSTLFSLRAASLALDLGDEIRIARSMASAACLTAAQGRVEATLRFSNAAARAAAAVDSQIGMGFTDVATTSVAFLLDNNWERTIALASKAEAGWAALGRADGWEVDVLDQLACWSLDNKGDYNELRLRVEKRLREARLSGNRWVEVNYRTFFVILKLLDDKPEEARADVREAIGSWVSMGVGFGNQHFLALRSLTYLALYVGDVDEAATELLPLWDRFESSLLRGVSMLMCDGLMLTAGLALARAQRAKERNALSEMKALRGDAKRRIARLKRQKLPMAAPAAARLAAGLAALDDDDAAVIAHLRDALAWPDTRVTIAPSNAAVRLELGTRLGGDEGRALHDQAVAWMRSVSAKAPSRLAASVMAGFRRDG